MKLRTTHNSIRMRVRKSELALLQQKQLVEERIQFPNGISFRFALVISETESTLSATFQDQDLMVSIPKEEAMNWMNTNKVSLESSIDLAGEEQLHILVEKDFPCLDREGEDKSDTFWELAPDSPDAC